MPKNVSILRIDSETQQVGGTIYALGTVVGGGGGGGGIGITDHGALLGLADNDHPQYLLRSGANVMTGNLDMDGHNIILGSGATVDGVDVAVLGTAYYLHVADANAHHAQSHSIVSATDHTFAADQYTVIGTPAAANTLAGWATLSDGTSGNVLLRSDANGALTLNRLTVTTIWPVVNNDGLTITNTSGTVLLHADTYNRRIGIRSTSPEAGFYINGGEASHAAGHTVQALFSAASPGLWHRGVGGSGSKNSVLNGLYGDNGTNQAWIFREGALWAYNAGTTPALTRYYISVNPSGTSPQNDYHFVLDSLANVGIGKLPGATEKLAVNGNVAVTGDITVTGTVDGVDVSAHAAASILTAHPNTATYGQVIAATDTATLGYWSSSTDGRNGNLFLRSDGYGGIRLNDLVLDDDLSVAGDTTLTGAINLRNYWTVNSTGEIRSSNPSYDPNGQGLMLTPSGGVYAQVLDAEHGRLSVGIFEMKSTQLHGGASLWTPRGALMLYSTLTLASGAATCTLHVADPTLGHYQQLEVGDIVQVRGRSFVSAPGGAETVVPILPAQILLMSVVPQATTQIVGEVWLEVTSTGTDETDHYSHSCDVVSLDGAVTIMAGAGIANYGQPTDDDPLGMVRIATHDVGGPRIDIEQFGSQPWDTRTLIGRYGDLSGISWLEPDELGLAVGTDLYEADEPHIVISQHRLELQNPDIIIRDDYLGEQTRLIQIGPDTGIAFYSPPHDPNWDYWGYVDEDGNSIPSPYTGRVIPDWTKIRWRSELNDNDSPVTYASLSHELVGSSDNHSSIASWNIYAYGPGSTAAAGISVSSYETSGSYPDNTYFTMAAKMGMSRATLYARRIRLEAPDTILLDAGRVEIGSGVETLVLNLRNLPTSSSGLSSGTVWSDSGTLKVVS